jgi:quinol monooxygenase YgiN
LKVTNGMKEMAAAVEANEPGALSYHYFINEENKQVVVLER